MKQVVVIACLIAAAMAAPATHIVYATPAPILARAYIPPAAIPAVAPAPAVSPKSAALARRLLPAVDHEEVHDEFGQFSLRYVTAEGTVVSERGRLIPSSDGKAHVMIYEGQISYVGPDGKTYITKYTAGLDGYKAEGAHLPVPPEPLPVQ